MDALLRIQPGIEDRDHLVEAVGLGDLHQAQDRQRERGKGHDEGRTVTAPLSQDDPGGSAR
jgi:hypothetical protein